MAKHVQAQVLLKVKVRRTTSYEEAPRWSGSFSLPGRPSELVCRFSDNKRATLFKRIVNFIETQLGDAYEKVLVEFWDYIGSRPVELVEEDL